LERYSNTTSREALKKLNGNDLNPSVPFIIKQLIMENTKYIPVKDYANKYEMSVQNVYQRLKRGKLQGKKIGNYQLILDN
jgi:hypothetical protein